MGNGELFVQDTGDQTLAVEAIHLPSYVATGPFCPGTRAGGWVFLSAQLPLDAEGALVGEGDFVAQANRLIDAVEQVLEASGLSLPAVAKLTGYIVNPVHFQDYYEVVGSRFPVGPPANTTVAVASLAVPEALIAVEAYAHATTGLRTASETGSSTSQSVTTGDTVWVSCLTSAGVLDPVSEDTAFSRQLRGVYKGIGDALEAAGSSFNDLVKINYFITNPLYYRELSRLRDRAFHGNPPSDDVVSIRALDDPQALVGADAIGLKPPSKADYVNLPGQPPPFNFSNVVVADGLAHVSGQTALETGGGFVGPGNFDVQFRNALEKVESALGSVDCDIDSIAKMSYFITHAGWYGRSVEIIEEFFKGQPKAVTGVVVDSIGGFPEALCEIDAIAVAP